MANLTYPYYQELCRFNSIKYLLKIFYLKDINELGTPDFWKYSINQLLKNYGWKNLFPENRFEIWHWNHPDMPNTIEAKWLKDLDPNTAGDQRAAGITINNYIGLAIDPANTAHTDIYKQSVVSHETGHVVSNRIGLFGDNKNYIQKEMYRFYIKLYRFLKEDKIFDAIVLPYERFKKDIRQKDIGDCLFYKKRLGTGLIAHEMLHCALVFDRLINNNKNAEYGNSCGEDEERLAYIQTEFVKQFVNKCYRYKIY